MVNFAKSKSEWAERGQKMPLAIVKVGEKVRVLRVTGTETTKKHLGALGFVPGALVTVVTSSHDNLIVAIHDSRIAVNDATAKNVEVSNV